jgi:diaminohydroxyphosphoribosylaminopyrimidine deaminase / 5-amino-6-(5-phosphoribosylamino)uracil reductase
MTINHNYYLNLAFQLAEKNLGKTGLNPTVGAVVVKNNTVISSGVTSISGRPHAEFNALNKIKNLKGATLYTSLEPCTHKGKTPPCTNIIIKKKIKNVYYGFEDPDLRTNKKAKIILAKNGVAAKLIKSKKYNDFYRSYFINKKLNTPFISAKIAVSKDYLSINKTNKWITNSFSRKVAHLIRSHHDGIISTSKSINCDNSLLNCRIEGLNNYKPNLFIIDLNLKLKKNLLLNKILKKRKTYLITYKSNIKKAQIYKKKGYKIILINSLKNKNDFYLLYKKLFKMGYLRILVETGLTFLNSLIKLRLINDLYIFKNNNKLKKKGKNNTSYKYIKNISCKLISINLNNDKLYRKEF